MPILNMENMENRHNGNMCSRGTKINVTTESLITILKKKGEKVYVLMGMIQQS